jgi:hypothetical protein
MAGRMGKFEDDCVEVQNLLEKGESLCGGFVGLRWPQLAGEGGDGGANTFGEHKKNCPGRGQHGEKNLQERDGCWIGVGVGRNSQQEEQGYEEDDVASPHARIIAAAWGRESGGGGI